MIACDVSPVVMFGNKMDCMQVDEEPVTLRNLICNTEIIHQFNIVSNGIRGCQNLILSEVGSELSKVLFWALFVALLKVFLL